MLKKAHISVSNWAMAAWKAVRCIWQWANMRRTVSSSARNNLLRFSTRATMKISAPPASLIRGCIMVRLCCRALLVGCAGRSRVRCIHESLLSVDAAMYQMILHLPDSHPLTFDEVFGGLQQQFHDEANISVERPAQNRIELCRPNWKMSVEWEDGPHVALEAAEIATRFASERPDHQQIPSCTRRISVSSDPDPDMAYFNDYSVCSRSSGGHSRCLSL